jgi:hypothetical protein
MGGKPRRKPAGPHGLPLAVQIHGQEWRIEYTPAVSDSASYMGECVPWHRVIRIDCNMAAGAMADTLLHEIMHAYYSHSDLQWEGEDEEAVITYATRSVMELIRVNGVDWV